MQRRERLPACTASWRMAKPPLFSSRKNFKYKLCRLLPEAQVPFGGLLELLRPALVALDRIQSGARHAGRHPVHIHQHFPRPLLRDRDGERVLQFHLLDPCRRGQRA